MPAFSPALTGMQDFLAERIDDATDIKNLVREAGVKTSGLALEGTASNMWHATLAYLDQRGEVRPVIERAAQDRLGGPDAEELTALLSEYEGGVPADSTAAPGGGPSHFGILIWTANPIDTEQLWTSTEIKKITRIVEVEAKNRDSFHVIPELAVGLEDLTQSLLRNGPSILHFSGHSDVGGLTLSDRDRLSSVLAVAPLAELMRIARASDSVGDRLRLVVFNSCHSDPIAEAVVQHVDCVIGTSAAIGDDAAIAFAEGLYEGLGAGESVQVSFDLGRQKVQAFNLGDELVPVLRTKLGADPKEIRFVAS